MLRLTSKLAITIYLIILIGLGFFAYFKYLHHPKTVSISSQQSQSSDSAPSLSSTDDLNSDNDADNNPANGTSDNPASSGNSSSSSNPAPDKNAPKVSPVPNVTGSMLAHITPEHCANNCQAFAIDLKLFEYCEQACGISPVKKVTDCGGQSGIQKDYCLKDLAIGAEDASKCDKINDANIKQACKSRIAQDAIENQASGSRSVPLDSAN